MSGKECAILELKRKLDGVTDDPSQMDKNVDCSKCGALFVLKNLSVSPPEDPATYVQATYTISGNLAEDCVAATHAKGVRFEWTGVNTRATVTLSRVISK